MTLEISGEKYILVKLPSGKLGLRKAPNQSKNYELIVRSNGRLGYRAKK